jgi:hypothetical protein
VVQKASDLYPLENVYIFAFDPVTELPLLAYAISNGNEGRYVLTPLPEGEFVVSALVLIASQFDHNPYLSEFFNGVQTLKDATLVSVHPSDTTTAVDFTLDQGSTIHGIVSLQEGVPAGADSLWRFPVVAYDAVTGRMVNLAWASFNGGYQLPKLPQGAYKVSALPGFFGYAATYYGGGTIFDDASSAIISLVAADTFRADITLGFAGGSISGTVHAIGTDAPLTASVVIAYEPSGHAAGFGFAGYDWMTEQPLDNNGTYEIRGLRSGTYYLRTWSIVSLLLQYRYLLDNFQIDLENPDIFGVLDLIFGVDFSSKAYGDMWYQDIYIPFGEYDMMKIVWNGLLYGLGSQYDPVPFTFFAPFPFSEEVKGQSVAVTDPGQTAGINFGLPLLQPEEILDVSHDGDNQATLPEEFVLHQNYPNPFNPTTSINFQIPMTKSQSHVILKIYNIMGQEVATLVDEEREPGYYTVNWDASQMPSGIYFYRLSAGGTSRGNREEFTATKSMVLIK